LDLEQIWYIIREKAWLILLFGLLGILGGLWYIHKTPLTYYAQAVIEVDPEPIKVIGYDEAVQATKDPISEDMAQTLKAVFHSREFAQQVIKNYDLLDNPNFIPRPPGSKPISLDDATGGLIGMEQINLPPETRFINVGIVHSDPEMAKELADALANHYCEHALEERTNRANTEINYLQEQADKASAVLTKSETDLNNYVKDKHADSLVDSHDTVVSDLRSKITELNAAKADLLKLQADDEQAQRDRGNVDALLAIPSVATDGQINTDKAAISDLRSKIQILQLRYTDLHPKMIQANTELADAENRLKTDALEIPDQIHAKLETAKVREANADDAVREQEVNAMALDDESIEYKVLQRKVDADTALYEGVLNRLKESRVANGLDSTGMHIFEPAQLPVDPVQARKSKTLCLGLIGGLVAGLVLSLGLHMMDSSLKSVDQAEDVLGLTVLASIPRQNQSKLKESSMALVKAPGSPVAEAFRSLRTSIYLAGKAKGRKIILFTSTLAGEGKTFCSTNYATALAQQGLKTLLVDADLRSPMIGSVMLANRKETGLGELLSRKVETASIHESEVENLWILPAGDLLPNPAEMLARSEMGEIVRQLSEKFDRIVIDTAPVTAVSDTLLLLEHAEVICLVAHVGRTPRKWLLRAMKLIAEAGSRPTGVILNQMPIRMAGAYSYYPGKYGEPEVYGSRNGSYDHGKGGGRKDEPEELVKTEPRF
jgi:capsular exopolysaccharide synthesis family protein